MWELQPTHRQLPTSSRLQQAFFSVAKPGSMVHILLKTISNPVILQQALSSYFFLDVNEYMILGEELLKNKLE